MKKSAIIVSIAALSTVSLAWAAERMWIQRTDRIALGMPTEIADSVSLTADGSNVVFTTLSESREIVKSEISNITFESDNGTLAVEITFDGSDAEIVNPYAFEGVTVVKSGADVVVTSTSAEELTYSLAGTTTSGSFKIYSDKKFILDMNSVSITNDDGAAINIQSGKKCTVKLTGTSTLTDAASYSTVSGEDQKGCFFSEGQIIFTGEGVLNVSANYKHGICSDDYIDIQSGTVNVLKAANDGVRVNDYFLMTGGTLTTTATAGDGIDGDSGYIQIDGGTIDVNVATADTKGIKCDSIITMNGGEVKLTVPADQGKGFKTKQTMTMNGGTITADMTGAAVVVSNDPSYCTAIKTDADFVMNDGTLNITHTGAGGKGVSADGNVTIAGGNLSVDVSGGTGTYTNTSGVSDMYASTCISADGSINVTGGTIVLGVKAASAKGFKSDVNTTISGGSITGTLAGDATVVNYDPSYCTLIKCDGDYTMNGGAVSATHSGNGGKGISVDGNATFESGTVTISTSGNGATYTASSGTDTYSPSCITVDGNLYLNGGTFDLLSSGVAGKCIKVDLQLIADPTEDGALKVTAETKGSMLGQSSTGGPGGGGPQRPGSSTSTTDTSSSPKVIKVTGNMTIKGGDFTIKSANEGGEGLESKAVMTISGGDFYFSTYDDCINASTTLNITGGNIRAVSTGNDAIDSNGTMSISGGLVLANGTRDPEEGIDVDQASKLTISGGIVINQKGNMLNLTTTQCKVPTVKYSSSITVGTLVTITDSSGNHIVSFKAPQAMSQGCYITHPSLKSGSSYKLYTGGSVSGGTVFNEVTDGGTYTAGTLKKSFTISSTLTSL
ncbi:MAG: carbohydrate-binding domain-containing protein [Muribaculaceae bacterium]|nr:carbohydrate-binding domain-containing protein [Muribaculaceae bacterium]